MRTFHFDLALQVRAVVPESFLAAQIEAASADDNTPFQAQLLAKYHAAVEAARGDEDKISDAGDQFLMELLGNGLRLGLRGHALAMLESSAIGGSVAPVEIVERIALKPIIEAEPVEDAVK
jgi:hypothetical protein